MIQSFAGESFDDGCGWRRTVAGTVLFRIGESEFVFDNPEHLNAVVGCAIRARDMLDKATGACRGCHRLVPVNRGMCRACAEAEVAA